MADLAATRERGYAIDHQEFQEGMNGASASAFNAKGQVIATLSPVGPAFRVKEDNLREYDEKCVELAAQLSTKLR